MNNSESETILQCSHDFQRKAHELLHFNRNKPQLLFIIDIVQLMAKDLFYHHKTVPDLQM